MNVVFFGSSFYVIPILEVLRKNFDLKLVVTTEKSNGAVPSFCKQNKIECITMKQFNNFQPKADPPLAETIQQLQKIKSPVAVLADFGLIIPREILNLFPKGILNIHPSLLPKYRGPTPVQTAILDGEKITGVSIIKLDEKVDHGPILAQAKEKILPTDTSETLYKRLFSLGTNLLPKTLDAYLKDDLKPTAQNHKEAFFTKPLTRQDGYLDVLDVKTAVTKNDTISAMIRAYYPWPGVWTRLHLGCGRLSLRNHDSSEVKEKIIKFFPGNLIQVEGKKPMSYKDFLNGYPDAAGVIQQILQINK